MAGRVVPNYVNSFPNTHIQHGFAVSIGSFKNDTNSLWAKYFNYPQTGLTVFYSNIGNNKIFGHQFSSLLFISYNLFNKNVKPYYLKLGIGASYFTTYYDSIKNPRNIDVGSKYMWAFQAFLYKTFLEKEGFNLRAGIGFSHASNGHTQLPNLGINSGLISLSTQFYNKKTTNYQLTKNKHSVNQKKVYSVSLRRGLGFHEYGDEDGPVGGSKRKVHSTSLALGKVYKQHLKLNIGITYRYYEQYYDQIIKNNYSEYIDNPKKSASNVVIYLGAEFLMSHFSIDFQLGVNVYKPFYKQFEKDFPAGNRFHGYEKFKSNFKRAFSSRLGLNLYLINTNKFPKHNIFIGTHIKANAGQADFTEVTLGYSYKIKPHKNYVVSD
ncbi:MAG: acyloxyacyl hydrolase [Flavobacteriales bacterium]|nr:acyloxyacyl hydrolase [Flavobacteriales bacterium]